MAMRDATRRLAYVALVALAFGCMPLAAQDAKSIHVKPGTEVQLVLKESLSSQTATRGQKFSLVVEQDVLVQGQVVIPKGSPATGLVVRAEPKGTFGKPGVLQLRIQSLTLRDQRIPLFYSSLSRGKERDGSAVLLTALFGPVGMLKQGKLLVVPAGTKMLAYVDQAFDVSPEGPAATNDTGALPGSDAETDVDDTGSPSTTPPTTTNRTIDDQNASSD